MSPRTALGVVHELVRGGVRARVGTVAAVLAGLWVDGHAVAEPIGTDGPPPGGCGIVLVPWPNRVRDGRWTLAGVVQQLDLTEPAAGNATHGLLRSTDYQLRDLRPDAVTLAALVPPQHGYPFLLDTWVTYRLTDDGLAVTHGATNLGVAAAPYAAGAHPYLRVGTQPVGELVLTVPATGYDVLDDRLLPVGVADLAGTPVDARTGLPLADADLNTCYRGLPVAGGTRALAWLDGDLGRTTLSAGAGVDYVQAYTNRSFPNAERLGLALEPMTAPADALNSGTGLRWLAPGESWQVGWAVSFEPR